MIDEGDILFRKIEPEFRNYPQLPSEIQHWALGAIRARVRCDFLQRLQESPTGMIASLDSFFSRMRQILNTDNESIMQGTDFNSADLDPERFDAMIAELRTVGFLHEQGFAKLRLLRATGKQRWADIIGFYGDTCYAVEVACSSRNAYRYPDHKRRTSDLIQWMVDRFHEKEEQLQETAKHRGCSAKTLVVVLNSWPALALLTPAEYTNMLREAWNRLGEPQDVYLAIVTGMVVSGHGLGDCVFPTWMANP